MKSWKFDSAHGVTGRATLEDETYVIVNFSEESSEAIEIDLKRRLIKVYDDGNWTFLPMTRDQQFNPNSRMIDHIKHL